MEKDDIMVFYATFCAIEAAGDVIPGWILPYLGMVGRFRGDDPRFGDL